MKTFCAQSGLTLIELLCSIALLGLITLSIATVSGNTIRINSFTQAIARDEIAVTRAYSVISSLIRTTERLRLADLVTITTGAHPTTLWGAPHPITLLKGTTRPRMDSDIITSISINPTLRGRVVKSIFNDTSITAIICQLLRQPSSKEVKKHLFIGSSSVCQMRGVVSPLSGDCYEFNGTPINTIMTSKADCIPQALLEYYPTESDRTIFVDRSGTLRLLSHSGLNITENQPITRGLRRLFIAQKVTDTGDIFYSLRITPSLAKTGSAIIPRRLTPHSFIALGLQ